MRKCSVEGCDNKHRRNGYCDHHSARVRRHGDPHKLNYYWKKNSDEERKAAIKTSQRAYYKTPKGKAANVLKRHRRKHREGEVLLTTHDVLRVFEVFRHECFKCKTKDDLTLDHHVPLVNGGKLTIDNAVSLCRRCNGLKRDLCADEYYSQDELRALEELRAPLLQLPSDSQRPLQVCKASRSVLEAHAAVKF